MAAVTKAGTCVFIFYLLIFFIFSVFVFQEQTWEPQQSALGHLNAYSAGFLQFKPRVHVDTVLPQHHKTQPWAREGRGEGGEGGSAGLLHLIMATVNDYFLFLLFLVSGVVG